MEKRYFAEIIEQDGEKVIKKLDESFYDDIELIIKGHPLNRIELRQASLKIQQSIRLTEHFVLLYNSVPKTLQDTRLLFNHAVKEVAKEFNVKIQTIFSKFTVQMGRLTSAEIQNLLEDYATGKNNDIIELFREHTGRFTADIDLLIIERHLKNNVQK